MAPLPRITTTPPAHFSARLATFTLLAFAPHSSTAETLQSLLVYILLAASICLLAYFLQERYAIVSPALMRHSLEVRAGNPRRRRGSVSSSASSTYAHTHSSAAHGSLAVLARYAGRSAVAPPMAASQYQTRTRTRIRANKRAWSRTRVAATERLRESVSENSLLLPTSGRWRNQKKRTVPRSEGALPTHELTAPLLPPGLGGDQAVRFAANSPLKEVLNASSLTAEMEGGGMGKGEVGYGSCLVRGAEEGGQGGKAWIGGEEEIGSFSRSETLVEVEENASAGLKKDLDKEVAQEKVARKEMLTYGFKARVEGEVRKKILKDHLVTKKKKLKEHRARKENWRLTSWKDWFAKKGLNGDADSGTIGKKDGARKRSTERVIRVGGSLRRRC